MERYTSRVRSEMETTVVRLVSWTQGAKMGKISGDSGTAQIRKR